MLEIEYRGRRWMKGRREEREEEEGDEGRYGAYLYVAHGSGVILPSPHREMAGPATCDRRKVTRRSDQAAQVLVPTRLD